MINRRIKDNLATFLIWLSAGIATSILVAVVTFIFSNGWSLISVDFLRNNYEPTVRFVNIETSDRFQRPDGLDNRLIFSENLGVALEQTEAGYVVTYLDNNSPLRTAIDLEESLFPVKEGHFIEEVNGVTINHQTPETEVLEVLNAEATALIKIRELGGGVFPMMVSTLLLVFVTLIVSAPLGILAAIYMVEYAKPGRFVKLVRFATEILSGIPSVVYGLFGMLMFVQLLKLGMSILSGALTMSILLLPIMMRTTEEALKTVPMSYREASYGLGANKIQTIYKVVLPSAMPGIMVGIILSTGRIVGESAALIFTVGTFASLPVNLATGNLSILETGATLTLRAFIEVKEFGNIEMASAIGIVILVIVFSLNMISRLIVKKLSH